MKWLLRRRTRAFKQVRKQDDESPASTAVASEDDDMHSSENGSQDAVILRSLIDVEPSLWKKHMKRLKKLVPRRNRRQRRAREEEYEDSTSFSVSENDQYTPPGVKSVVYGAGSLGVECVPNDSKHVSLDKFMHDSKSHCYSDLSNADTMSVTSNLLAVSFDQDYAQLVFVNPSSSEDSEDVIVSDEPLGITFAHPASRSIGSHYSERDPVDETWKKIESFRIEGMPEPVVVDTYSTDWENNGWSFSKDESIRPSCPLLSCGFDDGLQDHPFDEPAITFSSLTTWSSATTSRYR